MWTKPVVLIEKSLQNSGIVRYLRLKFSHRFNFVLNECLKEEDRNELRAFLRLYKLRDELHLEKVDVSSTRFVGAVLPHKTIFLSTKYPFRQLSVRLGFYEFRKAKIGWQEARPIVGLYLPKYEDLKFFVKVCWPLLKSKYSRFKVIAYADEADILQVNWEEKVYIEHVKSFEEIAQKANVIFCFVVPPLPNLFENLRKIYLVNCFSKSVSVIASSGLAEMLFTKWQMLDVLKSAENFNSKEYLLLDNFFEEIEKDKRHLENFLDVIDSIRFYPESEELKFWERIVNSSVEKERENLLDDLNGEDIRIHVLDFYPYATLEKILHKIGLKVGVSINVFKKDYQNIFEALKKELAKEGIRFFSRVDEFRKFIGKDYLDKKMLLKEGNSLKKVLFIDSIDWATASYPTHYKKLLKEKLQEKGIEIQFLTFAERDDVSKVLEFDPDCVVMTDCLFARKTRFYKFPFPILLIENSFDAYFFYSFTDFKILRTKCSKYPKKCFSKVCKKSDSECIFSATPEVLESTVLSLIKSK